MATNSQLNSVAFPEMRAVGEEGVVVVVGVTGGVAETMVETAEAVGGEGADHPEIVECHHPVIEEAVIMTVIAMTTVEVDIVVLLQLVVSLLPLVDFILVPMAMGSILLPLMVPMGVLMDLLLEGLVDLAIFPLVEVAVVTVDLLVHLVPLELAFLNLPILYLHKAHHQTVVLVALDQMEVAPLVLLPGAWVHLLEKDIQVALHLPAPLHLGAIWAMDDALKIWGDLPLSEMAPATIEVPLQAVVSF